MHICGIVPPTEHGVNQAMECVKYIQKEDKPMDQVKEILAPVVVGLPILNEVTSDGVITALRLEEAVLLGMTWGAWFKIGMGIALLMLIMERGLSVADKIRNRFNGS